MTTEHDNDIATLEQEARQMRARMNRQTEERPHRHLARLDAQAAEQLGAFLCLRDHRLVRHAMPFQATVREG